MPQYAGDELPLSAGASICELSDPLLSVVLTNEQATVIDYVAWESGIGLAFAVGTALNPLIP
ncbi:hypothetical protein D9V32_03785 [Mycetocola tolaasinivorans]|uniref:Uncharacterized protein n=1 Tax=Mycetocola tolaasinivorans TaxID=76635 RepID=A0A3L7A8U5_9MICO|nr:hypothetical protein D9V32_03785 [Mycetocola tolaasinivorans]